ncbi:hypothetical protein A9Q94_09225 [Rhodobacterales bacterium 56_14_T64]|nr:hypothetical protein A9Q94_09225 [Rhodobacterales bacterium 56_14_T64]
MVQDAGQALGPDTNTPLWAYSFKDSFLPQLAPFIGAAARSGMVAAIIGPSGVGKSTLMRFVAGIDTSFDGKASTLIRWLWRFRIRNCSLGTALWTIC